MSQRRQRAYRHFGDEMTNRNSEKGSVLVGAVMIMLVVGILILMITTNMLTALKVTNDTQAVLKARSNSDAGFDRVYLSINNNAGKTTCSYPGVQELSAGATDGVSVYYDASPLAWRAADGSPAAGGAEKSCLVADYVTLSVAGFGDVKGGKYEATYTQQVTFKITRTIPGTAGYIDGVVIRMQTANP
jgi:hypothetical protein